MAHAPKRIDGVLSKAIVSTISEPLLVLDEQLNVIVANPALYSIFKVNPDDTENRSFFELGDGQWDIPQLRKLLEELLPRKEIVEDYEVEDDFPLVGKRIMIINAREVKYQNGNRKMLLSFRDVTANRKLMSQKDMLLREMRHRIANSLQLIASILILKAADVQSEESRSHLQDAHDRIISIATVQRNLDPSGGDYEVPVTEYLTTLCKSLARSMIGGRKPITIAVSGTAGTATTDEAISLGLITTELVINALKHAFPGGEGAIRVRYASSAKAWSLSIADDGVGLPQPDSSPREGLGTSILDSLASQLNATISRLSSDKGTTVAIMHERRD